MEEMTRLSVIGYRYRPMPLTLVARRGDNVGEARFGVASFWRNISGNFAVLWLSAARIAARAAFFIAV